MPWMQLSQLGGGVLFIAALYVFFKYGRPRANGNGSNQKENLAIQVAKIEVKIAEHDRRIEKHQEELRGEIDTLKQIIERMIEKRGK